MQAQVKLGRVFGIRIGLHYSWILIAILIAFSLSDLFHRTNPEWSVAAVWGTAILTAVLFFVCILLHELGHSLVAQRRGIRVPSIVLFALGGISQMEKESPDAKTEFWMALAGPVVSFVIGLICVGAAKAFGWAGNMAPAPSPAVALLGWLGYVNLALGAFNLIPAYPLDGGRVFRAAAWWVTHSIERATRIASVVGQIFGFLFILDGLWEYFVQKEGFGALWIAFIGWFLLDAARSSRIQVEITHALSGVKVRDVMERNCALIEPTTNLQTLVDDYVLRTGQRCFIVQKDGRMEGLITPADISRVERRMWPLTTVEQAMRPLAQLRIVSPDAPVLEALETMARENLNQLPVASAGHVEGVLSRAHLLEILRARNELKV